jgi:hypothetical protein
VAQIFSLLSNTLELKDSLGVGPESDEVGVCGGLIGF